MAETFRKVFPGDPFEMPASLYNRLIDVALKQGNLTQDIGKGGLPKQTGIIKVRNDSGADRDRFEVLGLTTPLILPSTNLDQFKQEVAMAGEAPSSTAGKFGILVEPIKSGQIGRAVVQGTTHCKVDMTDALHTFAESSSGVTANLVSGTSGTARILAVESGTGVKWATVRMPTRVVEDLPTCSLCRRRTWRIDFSGSFSSSPTCTNPAVFSCADFVTAAYRTVTYNGESGGNYCLWRGPQFICNTSPISEFVWNLNLFISGSDVFMYVTVNSNDFATFLTSMPYANLNCDSPIVMPFYNYVPPSGGYPGCGWNSIASVTAVPL